MASTTSGNSRRMGLAIATAVAGLVLAGGVSIATLVGWVQPAQATESVQASVSGQPNLQASTSAPPQVILVPIAPTASAAQPPATRDRSEGARVHRGERDDD